MVVKVETSPVTIRHEISALLQPYNADPEVWSDSAYRSRAIERLLDGWGYTSHLHEKGTKDHALSEAAQVRNRLRAKVRARVEHVFGAQDTSFGGKFVRTIGLARAAVKIGLTNLAYNMTRFLSLLDARAPMAAVGA